MSKRLYCMPKVLKDRKTKCRVEIMTSEWYARIMHELTKCDAFWLKHDYSEHTLSDNIKLPNKQRPQCFSYDNSDKKITAWLCSIFQQIKWLVNLTFNRCLFERRANQVAKIIFVQNHYFVWHNEANICNTCQVYR